ncbi:hypothetical protein BLL52_1197 [Rhodoferax antarcticus ANT.BR]|uniref:Uncharacterized protein n=1 Tax=Rhodoferax antarcticus ANT.BR TaxID=1111071 RepID=A0A1Q8YHC9_9BURK|nr:hypothetical protein BLL52_1197 [Rhodoferax antarcticus ANT.BR]
MQQLLTAGELAQCPGRCAALLPFWCVNQAVATTADAALCAL